MLLLLLGITAALLGNLPVSYAQSDRTADELEELLNEEGDEVEVETEEDFALPVPTPEEEQSPVLDEIDQGPLAPSEATEDLFLPVPSDQVGVPSVNENYEDDFSPFYRAGDVRHSTSTDEDILRKPGTVLWVGYANKEYTTNLLPDVQNGLEVGLSARLWRTTLFSLPFNFHVFGAVTYINLDDLVDGGTTFVDNVDLTIRLGGLIEWEISRRIQLFAGAGKYFTEISTQGALFGGQLQDFPAGATLKKVDEDPFFIGVGAQWDFHVRPHGSLGLRGWAEVGYVSFLLTFTMEPIPKRRVSLNYDLD